MCGIQFTNNPNVSEKKFRESLKLLIHRGPDAEPSTLFYENFKLGHTRLKILDLDDRSNQPFWSKDKRYVIIFNGEIYNYRELAKAYNINQTTTSDTEVLIELYVKLGPEMLHLLNGMFSIVIFDSITKDFFVARDRLGVKPLYYSKSGDSFFFASEISPVLHHLQSIEFDEIGVRQYRKMRTFFNQRTIYKDVKMFPPGCYMQSGKMIKYWEYDICEQGPPSDDELKDLIISAVNYRCISDVPVGSYLSGGLDSTIVSALAKNNLGDIYTWTVGFKNNNEFDFAKLAAQNIGSNHLEIITSEAEFTELAREMISKRKEPLSVPNEVLLYKMTQNVKQKNTVVLSGEGADELFFGYDRIFKWASENNWDLEKFSKLYCYGSNNDLEIVEEVISPFLKHSKAIDIVSSFFQTAHLHGLLRRLDNATMFCSVEARVPFVDFRLVERMKGVHFNHRMNNGLVKAPLKRIFSDILPQQIIYRPKIGFPVSLEKIDFGKNNCKTSMDNWLVFNLNEIGVPDEMLKSA